MTSEWDKVFPQSDKVTHSKVTFRNRYGITLAADLYMPKDAAAPMAAIAVSGPFGAVKEQASGLYAQTMAERGFLTIAFIRERAAANPATLPRPISTRRISVRRSTISLRAMMSIRSVSVSWVYAVGAAWP